MWTPLTGDRRGLWTSAHAAVGGQRWAGIAYMVGRIKALYKRDIDEAFSDLRLRWRPGRQRNTGARSGCGVAHSLWLYGKRTGIASALRGYCPARHVSGDVLRVRPSAAAGTSGGARAAGLAALRTHSRGRARCASGAGGATGS